MLHFNWRVPVCRCLTTGNKIQPIPREARKQLKCVISLCQISCQFCILFITNYLHKYFVFYLHIFEKQVSVYCLCAYL